MANHNGHSGSNQHALHNKRTSARNRRNRRENLLRAFTVGTAAAGLLAIGANRNNNELCTYGYEHDHKAMITIANIFGADEHTVLYEAIYAGKINAVKNMLSPQTNGSNIEEIKATALLWAIQSHQEDITHYLLDTANTDIAYFEAPTALQVAVASQNLYAVHSLLKLGALEDLSKEEQKHILLGAINPDATKDGFMVFSFLVSSGVYTSQDLEDVLRQHKANSLTPYELQIHLLETNSKRPNAKADQNDKQEIAAPKLGL